VWRSKGPTHPEISPLKTTVNYKFISLGMPYIFTTYAAVKSFHNSPSSLSKLDVLDIDVVFKL
jgi:hypothetical protein